MINLRIENNNLLVSNIGLLDSQKTTRLVADIPANSGTISVAGISGFAVNNYILIGKFGDSSAEIVKIHTSTSPTGIIITLAANTVRDHYADSPVTLLDYDQVEFSRANTLDDTKTILGTQDINADKIESYYKDLVNSNGFAFVRFYNSHLAIYSEYSTGVPYSGLSSSTVSDIVNKACSDSLVEVGGDFSTEKQLLNDVNDCQDAITDYDWKFELVSDDVSIKTVQFENTYSLGRLKYELKYPGISQGVKSVKFSNTRLQLIDNDEMDLIYNNVIKVSVVTIANISDTSIVLNNTSELPESGVIYINGMSIFYTTNDVTTNTLSGIDAGDITSVILAGSIAWYNINPGIPTKYTITIDNNIVLNCPVNIERNGYPLKVEYLKKLNRLTDFSSTTEIPFTDSMQLFVAAKIERRKRNQENHTKLMEEFNNSVGLKLAFYKLPVMDDSKYYNFK